MIKAVIFDMDGLLIDSEVATYNAYKAICSRYGQSFDMTFYHTLLGANAIQIQAKLIKYLGDPIMAKNIIKEVHMTLELTFSAYGVPIKKGARDLITDLKEQGIRIAVATSSSRNRAINLLGHCGILKQFDVIICGDDVTESKPHPEIFLKAQEALGSHKDETIVIEDSENGIIGAHRSGMRCINVPDIKEPSSEIVEKADFIAMDLFEAMGYIRAENNRYSSEVG